MSKKNTHTTKHVRAPRKHTVGDAAKVYWPYLPMIALLVGGLFLNVWQPLQKNQPATLAYATEMSIGGLLSGTNTQRANNGLGALGLNSQLNAAAQAKANDMVTRDYWSHNTPEGNPPWVFIDAQGYAYTKAGENLAYGFSTSSATITGWMNSPSHKANILDTVYTEVGFGFSNSANFVGTGEATVVVAMYATPVNAPPPPPPPAPEPEPEPEPQTKPATVEQAQPEPEPEQPVEVAEEEPVEPTAEEEEVTRSTPVTTATDVPDDRESTRITLLQQLTQGNMPWIAGAVSFVGLSVSAIWLMRHAVLVRRFVVSGEHFVAHHPILDLIVVALVALAVYFGQSSGIVL